MMVMMRDGRGGWAEENEREENKIAGPRVSSGMTLGTHEKLRVDPWDRCCYFCWIDGWMD
jgi:hypothetical protein